MTTENNAKIRHAYTFALHLLR